MRNGLLFALGVFIQGVCFAQASDGGQNTGVTCDSFQAMHLPFSKSKDAVSQEIKRDDRLLKLILKIGVLEESADKDLAEFTNSADFNLASQKSLAANAVSLSLYCTTHKAAILRDIDPLDVVRHPMEFMGEGAWKAQLMDASAWYKDAIATCGKSSQCSAIANNYREHTSACLLHGGNQAACDAVKQDASDWAQMKSSSNQITSNDPALNKWVAESLVWCGSNTSCSTIVKSYQAHTIACSQGNQQACVDHDRDLKDWDSITLAGAGQSSGDAKMQCLQQVMNKVMAYCNQGNCPEADRLQVVRSAQQAECGFSAIEPSKPYVAPTPQFPSMSDCSYSPRSGGGFNSTCTQY